MANEKYFIRYIKIIQRIKRGDNPSLTIVLECLSEYGFDINKRTFNRDLNAILDLFDIEIHYDRTQKGYYINEVENDFISNKLQEALDIFSSIKIVGKERSIISFDTRKPSGTEHLYYILDAIKNCKILRFEHRKYHKQEKTDRIVEPYMVKESQGRWYLVAKDKKDNQIKTFGLDRISMPHSTTVIFSKPKNIDLDSMFDNCFGITNNNKPQDIEIKVYGANAYFIKSFKLHTSQTIIKEDKKFIIFKLYLSVTDDFVMELMKYGADIEVLAPISLKKILIEKYNKALLRNR